MKPTKETASRDHSLEDSEILERYEAKVALADEEFALYLACEGGALSQDVLVYLQQLESDDRAGLEDLDQSIRMLRSLKRFCESAEEIARLDDDLELLARLRALVARCHLRWADALRGREVQS